jgi:hypothetical protein
LFRGLAESKLTGASHSTLAIPSGSRENRSVDKRPLRVGLVLLPAALALTAILLTACGGSDDRTKVEASLRHYLIHPHACINYRFCPQGAFPVGAGAPQVREKSCKKIHIGPARLPEGHPRQARLPEGLSGWSCVITFPPGKTALPVAVAVKDNFEVSWAAPTSRQALPPATVYQGGPEQPQP